MSAVLDNIFINLRIIAKIPEKGKIKISTISPGQVKLEEDNYATKIWRTLTRDSRTKSIKLLMGLFNDVNEFSDNIISSLYYVRQYEHEKITMFQLNENARKCHILKKLVRELTNARPGLKNLASTYRSDPNTISGIEEIEDKIDLQISKIQAALRLIDPTGELYNQDNLVSNQTQLLSTYDNSKFNSKKNKSKKNNSNYSSNNSNNHSSNNNSNNHPNNHNSNNHPNNNSNNHSSNNHSSNNYSKQSDNESSDNETSDDNSNKINLDPFD